MNLVKSKHRVADHGEVFTPAWMVEAMLDDHIRNHRGEWLIFLHDPEVPPTNNHAEQMLRPAVITRKIGGCNKTLWGALVHSVLASLMVTCKRQGKHFLDLARQLWQTSQPQTIDLATLTAV